MQPQPESLWSLMVAGKIEGRERVGNGDDDEGLPIQAERREGLENLQSEDELMDKIFLENNYSCHS